VDNNHSKVSIGLPVFNGDEFLSDAIKAVLAQSFTDFELIISDNASTDRTQEICKAFSAQDDRIKYLRQSVNRGAGWNFNEVFRLASGEYFKWLAHDDLIAPDFLEKCVKALDADPSVVLSYPKTVIIDAKGEFLNEYHVHLNTDSTSTYTRFRDLVLEWSLCFEVFGLIRSKDLQRVGGMGNYGHGDGVLLARLGILGRFYEIPEQLNFSRKHATQSIRVFGLSESGGNDYHRYTEWFNPMLVDHLIFPNWKIFWEFYISIWRFPMSASERLLGHLIMIKWMRHHVRHLVNDLIFAVKFLVRKKKP